MPQHLRFTVALLLGVSHLAASGRAQPPFDALLPRVGENPPVIASTRPPPPPPAPKLQIPPPGPPLPTAGFGPSAAIQRVAYTEEPRSPNDSPTRSAVPPAPPAPRRDPVPETPSPTAGSALVVAVTGPETLNPGQPAVYQIVVRNGGTTPLAGVRLEQPAPEGVRVAATEPAAVVEQNRLVWSLGTIDSQAEKRLKLELIPGTARELTLEPRATFTGSAALKAHIAQQPLTAQQLGPLTAERGSKVVIQIQVTNNTGAPLHQVMVRDHLPRGMQHAEGERIEAELGTLAAGETRSLPLEVEITQAGRLVNEVVAWAQEGPVARSQGTIQVKETPLQHQVTAPQEAGLNDVVDVRLDILNASPGTLRNIKATCRYAAGLEAVAHSGGAGHDPVGRAVYWQVDSLAAGQTATVVVRLRGLKPGSWSYQTQVTAEGVPTTQATRVLTIGPPRTSAGPVAGHREGTVNE